MAWQLEATPHSSNALLIKWIALQNHSYFLGGRASRKRLSAACIGKRMLNVGNDRVPPAVRMWPLQ